MRHFNGMDLLPLRRCGQDSLNRVRPYTIVPLQGFLDVVFARQHAIHFEPQVGLDILNGRKVKRVGCRNGQHSTGKPYGHNPVV